MLLEDIDIGSDTTNRIRLCTKIRFLYEEQLYGIVFTASFPYTWTPMPSTGLPSPATKTSFLVTENHSHNYGLINALRWRPQCACSSWDIVLLSGWRPTSRSMYICFYKHCSPHLVIRYHVVKCSRANMNGRSFKPCSTVQQVVVKCNVGCYCIFFTNASTTFVHLGWFTGNLHYAPPSTRTDPVITVA